MTFLPIVQRELRVAARRNATWWVRLATSALAIFACGSFLVFAGFGQMMGTSIPRLGETLFTLLTWYSFGLCLLAGIFVTADSLSEEKREGTLGLLFLTDLRGHDVVLGKFFARSLNSFYSLFALLPVMSVTLLMGGVTGAEFARVSVALVNTLFVSLAVGMLVSAHSREYREATGRTVVLLALLVVLLPLCSEAAQWLDVRYAWLATPSPLTPFRTAFENSYALEASLFWGSLGFSHLTGWAMLAVASWRLPKLWQSQPVANESRSRFPALDGLLTRRRKESPAQRARWLDINPVLWLNRRFAGSAILLTVIAIGWGVLMAFTALIGGMGDVAELIVITKLVFFLFKLLVAIEACRFFAEARRTGAIELLLCSPLTNQQIREGQWLALRRLFFKPMLVILTTSGCLIPWFIIVGAVGWGDVGEIMGLGFYGAYPLLNLVLDIYAAAHVGLWLSLTIKKPHQAAGYTILFTLVLPSIAFIVPDPVISLGLIAWAKGNFDGDIRFHIRRHFEPPVKIVRGSAKSGPPALPPPLPVARG